MALLFIDGFEAYGTANSAPTANSIVDWEPINGTAMYIREGRDASGLAISLESSNQFLVKKLNTTNETLVVGFAMYLTSIGAGTFTICELKSSQTQGVNLRLNSTGSITVRRGTTTLGTSANTGVITTSNWHYVEMAVKCNDSTGTYDVWVDDVNELTGSGVDTKAGTLAYHDSLWLGSGTLSSAVRFDDFYALDASGSTHTSRIGSANTYIRALWPDGDDTTNWTATGGSTHYDQVNSTTFNGSEYIETDTTADQDIFTYENFTVSGATIEAVQINTVAKEEDAKSYPLQAVAESAGNTVCSSDKPVGSTDWIGFTHVMATDPDGDAWTSSTVNSTKFGVEVG